MVRFSLVTTIPYCPIPGPHSFTLGNPLAHGGTGLCDPGLVTEIIFPRIYLLYFLLVLVFFSPYTLDFSEGKWGKENRESWGQGLKFYIMCLGRSHWEGDICLKTCKEGESMNLSAGRVLRAEGTANAKALWWEHDWHVGGTAGHLCGWSVVNKWVTGEQGQRG